MTDRQHVLPFGTPEDVRTAVHRVRNSLDNGNGGVIAQCEWGKDNSRDNIEAVILGGTELPLLLRDPQHNGVPFLDTTKIHVERIVAELVS